MAAPQNQHAGTNKDSVGSQEVLLSFHQKRRVQGEQLYAYEGKRQALAQSMSSEVGALRTKMNTKLKAASADLHKLLIYFKARGAAERSYADALRKAQIHLPPSENGFSQVDTGVVIPRALEMSGLCSGGLVSDISSLHAEVSACMAALKSIEALHKELLGTEKTVRGTFQSLARALFRNPVDSANEPWLFEQRYREALHAANRHGERFIKQLSEEDDAVILLLQKQEALKICAEKLFIFEVVRHGTDDSCKLETIAKGISGDAGVLNGEKTIQAVSADLLDSPASCEDADVPTPDTLKYPFEMDLPPLGTSCYEGDLKMCYNAAPGDAESLCTLVADESIWQRVRAVLTDDRVFHLFRNDDEGSFSYGTPQKSFYCCPESGAGVEIRRSNSKVQKDFCDTQVLAEISRCFEVSAKSSSFLKTISWMGGAEANEARDNYLFRADETRDADMWVTLLETDVNRGGGLAVLMTCVADNEAEMPLEEHQQGSSIGNEPLDCEGLEASLDALCSNRPEDMPGFETRK